MVPLHPESRFQILSLDGGGIKGLFSAAVLAALEEDLRIDVTEHFDLIAGTSTGGIIAVGLGLGMRPREIVEFYVREGPRIFRPWLGWKSLQHWAFRKFDAEPLATALRSCFRDKRFGDSRKRLVIPAFNLGENDVHNFRTAHNERLGRDFKIPAWKVALATSSAPTFFPCTREIERMRLIDGGVWANNPTMVAVVEAYEALGVPLENQQVLSIGTSDAVVQRASRLDSGGILAWALGNAAIDVIMRGQTLAATNQAKLLLGRDRVERLNPSVADGEFSLDRIDKADDLIGKAAHHSRSFSATFRDKFGKHRAAAFEPLYR